MSNQVTANTLGKATRPGKAIDSITAIEPAGKNSMKPVTLGNGQLNVTPVALMLVTPEQAAQLLVMPHPQQPITINVQQNITCNNFNAPSQEPPKHGHHEGSQGRLDQDRQQATPKSRTIESRPSGVDSLCSKALITAPKAHPKSHDGAEGKSSSPSDSRCAEGQRRQTQNIHKLETSSIHTTRPADGMVPPRAPQQEHRNSVSSNATSARGEGQAPQRKTQPENNSHGRSPLNVSRSQSDSDNGSRPKTTTPASVTKAAASGRHDSNSTRSRESSTARRPQNYGNSQLPHYHNQAASGPAQTLKSGRQAVAGPPHVEPQPNRQHGAVHVPQRHPAVGQGTGAAAGVAEAIGEQQIEAGFERLNASLGNFKDPKGSQPARVILIGKASTEMMKLEDREQAYHIDVIVDLPGGHERRSCMEHNHIIQLFREFDKPHEPPKSPHSAALDQKSFFGRDQQARAAALNRIIKDKKECDRIFNKAHLKVYVMKPTRALRFELSRMAHPDTDEKSRRASGSLVVRLLWHEIEKRAKAGRPRIYQEWRNDLRMEDDFPIPGVKGLIKEVEGLFKERYGDQGTV